MDHDQQFMRIALELAKRGEGWVEPNPMVGCVLVKNGNIIGEGFHTGFGKAHAEIEALHNASCRYGKEAIVGSTCYVTLEPCSHYGKTPPCTASLLPAGIKRVVVAMRDPNPAVNGKGLHLLRHAGLEITEHVLEEHAKALNAPYLTLLEKNRPWIIAKWAMTLDGRSASKTGNSQWISNDASRRLVHGLRSRVDAILVGSQTALRDNPNLTARIDGVAPRIPMRIVLDSNASLAAESRLVQTAHQIPVLLVVNSNAPTKKIDTLKNAGCQILSIPTETHTQDYPQRIKIVLEYLAQQKITNLLVEGGKTVFGTLFDCQLVDEVHAFVAPKIIGSESAYPVVGGNGLNEIEKAWKLKSPDIQLVEHDVYIRGRVDYSPIKSPT
jgi:diaminohydroxyphosphoribosylaminopyrimidine deaminase/5-amino-6-(5-phosphoribosylamino)uracil reductase